MYICSLQQCFCCCNSGRVVAFYCFLFFTVKRLFFPFCLLSAQCNLSSWDLISHIHCSTSLTSPHFVTWFISGNCRSPATTTNTISGAGDEPAFSFHRFSWTCYDFNHAVGEDHEPSGCFASQSSSRCNKRWQKLQRYREKDGRDSQWYLSKIQIL